MIDLSSFPRVNLGHLPTPLEPLTRLSEILGGPEIWIKRDDCTGLASGGNKTRKLEFLMGEAQGAGADTIITVGALQSNHVRQTVAASARLGFACEVILVDKVDHAEPAYRTSGNLLLNDLLGGRVHIVADAESAMQKLGEIQTRLSGEARIAYLIPLGGSNAVGALGYVNCAAEISLQSREAGVKFDTLIHASSSGGTQAGLLAGSTAMGSSTSILGINVNEPDPASLTGEIAQLCKDLSRLCAVAEVTPDRIQLNSEFVGRGYGLPTTEMTEAVRLVATAEGILLDPVYTGKAMSALIGLTRSGELTAGMKVLFVHTGGTPGLYAYQQHLTGTQRPTAIDH